MADQPRTVDRAAGREAWLYLGRGMAGTSDSSGSGPGVITPDGCAVEFYARLSDFGEPAIVHDAAGAGASILELGCGTGRITHPLVALGHQVVAVDESPHMLAYVQGAEIVCARIEELSLGRRFDAVLLASHLVNAADAPTRAAFLAACRRHVADDGCVIIQRHGPDWFSEAGDAESARDGIVFRMRDVSRPGPNLVSATVEYVIGDQRWTQTFTAMSLDDAALAAVLAEAGLRLDGYLTDDRTWLRAVPRQRPLSRLPGHPGQEGCRARFQVPCRAVAGPGQHGDYARRHELEAVEEAQDLLERVDVYLRGRVRRGEVVPLGPVA
jgi:SAM-dependent methyltransferase